MPHPSEPDLLVLHALRLTGFAEPDKVVEITGLAEDDVADEVAKAAAGDLIVHREGRVSGWSLTPAGRAVHSARLEDERRAAHCDDVLAEAYDGFVLVNETLKQVCTDWQLKPGGDQLLPNDHSDAAYDAAIVERLVALHGEVTPVLGRAAGALDRFGRYEPRLAAAQARFSAGEQGALARPLSGSYHDVWMELHQDLLLTIGRERSDADGH